MGVNRLPIDDHYDNELFPPPLATTPHPEDSLRPTPTYIKKTLHTSLQTAIYLFALFLMSSGMFLVRLRRLNGADVKVSCTGAATTSVSELRDLASAQLGVPSARLRLLYKVRVHYRVPQRP